MRKYLKNEFEVIKELKNGKTVYEEYYPFYHYIMIDGIICGECSKNTKFLINCAMDMDNKFYIEEEKHFTIEEDRFYKTRDGDKAYCYIVEEDICYFALAGHGHFLTDKSGNYEGAESGFDIVDYWEE